MEIQQSFSGAVSSFISLFSVLKIFIIFGRSFHNPHIAKRHSFPNVRFFLFFVLNRSGMLSTQPHSFPSLNYYRQESAEWKEENSANIESLIRDETEACFAITFGENVCNSNARPSVGGRPLLLRYGFMRNG
jgi:hypothetical protein